MPIINVLKATTSLHFHLTRMPPKRDEAWLQTRFYGVQSQVYKTMSEPSLSDQATNPDQSVVASQQAQPLTSQNAQGSAMLDADREAGGSQPQGEPIAAPIATNTSTASGTGDPKTAGVASEMGAFSTNNPAEKGAVNLHNNPDVPGNRDNSLSGTLPDTDPVKMPTDPETNLPD
jgi:hypothetical protein